jgi:hypothetical protein
MPQAEQCNGLDDDCDGSSDEVWQTEICGQGICARPLIQCPGDPVPVCDPLLGAQAELCDGEDDDCDGTVDENANDAGADCTVGVGACQRQGLETCVNGGILCIGQPGQPDDEECNLIDDDCDGLADEGLNCDAQNAVIIDYTYEDEGQAMAVWRLPLDARWTVRITPIRLVQARMPQVAWQVDATCTAQPVPGPTAMVQAGDLWLPIRVTLAHDDCPTLPVQAAAPTWPDAQVVYGAAPTRMITLYWPDGRTVEVHDDAIEPRSPAVERDAKQRIVRVSTPAATVIYTWQPDGTATPRIESAPTR